jgi:hypothetical protein
VRDNALGFVVVIAAGVEVAAELRKVAAADFEAQLVSGSFLLAKIFSQPLLTLTHQTV